MNGGRAAPPDTPAGLASDTPRPAALAAWQPRDIVGVLTDLDDTLTTEGRLTPSAYAALCALHAAGLHVIPVTGRSAGWAHMILKTWPVAAVVAESGGLWLHREPGSGRALRHFHAPAPEVAQARHALQACARQVLAAVPGLAPASDNAFRLVDLALDHCEEVAPAGEAAVTQALGMFRDAGFSARASSVHVNAWAGAFDKASSALDCLRTLFPGRCAPERWAFIGDAPNDESMFAGFPVSLAVANIRPHLPSLGHRPAFMTDAASGAGFEAFARHLLAAISGAAPSPSS